MRVFVVFPKQQCYYQKDIGVQRLYKEKFMKYLKLLKDAKCEIEILLEDKLANDMTFDAGITPARVISCITPTDIGLIENYPDIEELDKYVFSSYESVDKEVYDAEKKNVVPLSVMKEGKAAYFNKRVQSYHRRYLYALNRYITECRNVLQFRLDNPMDRGVAVKSTVSQGDGRLCIEVGVNSGTVASYYGGVFITEDTLPMILSL